MLAVADIHVMFEKKRSKKGEVHYTINLSNENFNRRVSAAFIPGDLQSLYDQKRIAVTLHTTRPATGLITSFGAVTDEVCATVTATPHESAMLFCTSNKERYRGICRKTYGTQMICASDKKNQLIVLDYEELPSSEALSARARFTLRCTHG